MKTPAFSFEAEIRTDAPFGHIRARMQDAGAPADFHCLRALRHWQPTEFAPEEILMRWELRKAGAWEQGTLIIRPDAKGAHLRLEVRMKGWSAFLLFGVLRWRTDRLLDRFVEEL